MRVTVGSDKPSVPTLTCINRTDFLLRNCPDVQECTATLARQINSFEGEYQVPVNISDRTEGNLKYARWWTSIAPEHHLPIGTEAMVHSGEEVLAWVRAKRAAFQE